VTFLIVSDRHLETLKWVRPSTIPAALKDKNERNVTPN